MSKLNVFIDGTWLLVQCAPDGSMANATDRPNYRFPLDFAKLNQALLKHVNGHGAQCDGMGEMQISTSIFALPDDFDAWPTQYDNVLPLHVERVRRAVAAREAFVAQAAAAGYRTDAVYYPPIREHIIRRLIEGKYQEKQVDASVVALLVRSAITHGADHHVVVTGDADILPAMRVAYPEFTKNVLVCTTHPDELNKRHHQTAHALVEAEFDIPPFYLQNKENAVQIIEGAYAHRCEECGTVFTVANQIPERSRPRCLAHRAQPASRSQFGRR